MVCLPHPEGDDNVAADLSLHAGGLNQRHLALLRAVATDHAEISCSREPDLVVDGLPCCDHMAAGQFVHAGLLVHCPERSGARVPTQLTTAGRTLLDQPEIAAPGRQASRDQGRPSGRAHLATAISCRSDQADMAERLRLNACTRVSWKG
jgi:hypothetical protein